MHAAELRTELILQLADPMIGEKLFDEFDNLTFFVKNRRGQYVSVNQALVTRCGESSKDALLGRTSAEVFPEPLGDYFFQQDMELIQSGRPLTNEIEQHPYPRRETGWCLTTKLPLTNRSGQTVGLVGMSRDLQSPDEDSEAYAVLSRVIDYIKGHLAEPLKTPDLAELAELSVWQLDQRMRELFGCTTAQLILQLRMDSAAKRLSTTRESIIAIALASGYGNQSAFSRQFRKTFGMPPGDYRRRHEARFIR